MVIEMTKKSLISVLLLIVLPFLLPACYSSEDQETSTGPQISYYAKVVKVYDGDTIELDNGEIIRYIGIDTPEICHPYKPVEYYGEEAYRFNKKLVDGKRVGVELDVQKKDKYGRTLAYIYLEDGTFVNAELIKQGYAQILTIPPNVKYQDLFLKLQREAREARRGLWGKIDEVIDQSQAKDHIGEVRTVRGKVLSTYQGRKAVFLNFGQDYRTDFTITIFARDWEKNFVSKGIRSPSYYEGKTVLVTGKIKEYHGPEIIVSDPSEIKIE